jgi:hypothetical protein
MSNIFDKLAADYHANDFKLGMPSTDEGHFVRRLTVMERIAGGKGFRTPAKEPATRGTTGKTRGQLEREARELANAKVSESRPYTHMHSAARRCYLEAQVLAAAE